MRYRVEQDALDAARKAYSDAHWRREAYWRIDKPLSNAPDPLKEAIEVYLNHNVAPPRSFA